VSATSSASGTPSTCCDGGGCVGGVGQRLGGGIGLVERHDRCVGGRVAVVEEQLAHDVAQAVAALAAAEGHGDHVAVDVHAHHAARREESPGQLVDGPLEQLAGRLQIALVPHARQGPIGLEPQDGRVGGGVLLDDSDRLTHRWRHATHGVWPPRPSS
jgi:hypothetical protein